MEELRNALAQRTIEPYNGSMGQRFANMADRVTGPRWYHWLMSPGASLIRYGMDRAGQSIADRYFSNPDKIFQSNADLPASPLAQALAQSRLGGEMSPYDPLEEVKVTAQRIGVDREGSRNARDIASMRTGQTFGNRGDGVGAWQDFDQRWQSLLHKKVWGSGDSRHKTS